jgi:hypothetical protein
VRTGGTVIAQVERIADGSSLPRRGREHPGDRRPAGLRSLVPEGPAIGPKRAAATPETLIERQP